jgi:hypothetical protein
MCLRLGTGGNPLRSSCLAAVSHRTSTGRLSFNIEVGCLSVLPKLCRWLALSTVEPHSPATVKTENRLALRYC